MAWNVPQLSPPHVERIAAMNLLALTGLLLLAQPADTVPPVVISHVTVITGTDAAPLTDRTVILAGGRIQSIVPAALARPPRGATLVDGRGRFLIPGLWDMHTHLANRPLLHAGTQVAPLDANRTYVLPLLLSYGVTGVRDMAGDLATLKRWRQAIAAGTLLGPHLVFTGKKLGKAPVVPGAPYPIQSDDDVRASVRALRQGGADFIKVDGLAGRFYPGLFRLADSVGLQVVGHTAIDLGAVKVAQLGQRSIEHLDGLVLACSAEDEALRADALAEKGWWRGLLTRVGLSDPEENFRERYRRMLATQSLQQTDSVLQVFRTHETWQVPTLVMLRDIRLLPPSATLRVELDSLAAPEAGEPPPDVRWVGDTTLPHQLFRRERDILGQMIDAGVPILAGTDGPGGTRLPGAALHDELQLLVDAGMTPLQALQAATSAPARFLGAADSLGTVAEGKVADLVLLDADPLADIGNTRQIRSVFLRGRLLDRATLDSLRQAAARVAGH